MWVKGNGKRLAEGHRRNATLLNGRIFDGYKGSAWVPAIAGTHASGRAGQHFELFDSIIGRVKEVTTQS